MAKTRAIVKRRKAIRNIRKITRTMELIATARYRKALDRAVQAEVYTKKITEIVAAVSKASSKVEHPLLEPRDEPKRSVLLLLTSNRGLCGGYNANVLRMGVQALAETAARHPVELEISGKRGNAFFKYRVEKPAKFYSHFEDKPTYEEVEKLADRYIDLFLERKIDKLEVVYTRFVSLSKQFPEKVTLLPMTETGQSGKTESASGKSASVQYDFMPSAAEILTEIVPVSFKIRLFKCFLDAAVSEQISRMVAMKGATENAGSLIKLLTRRYNRARQSQITSELAEIIGTAEALK